MLVFIAIQMTVRTHVSTPRIGYAETKRTPALKIALAVTFSLVLLTVVLLILTLTAPERAVGAAVIEKTWLQRYSVDIIAMLAMAGVFSMLGFLFAVPRIYLYGLLLGGANLIAQIYDLDEGVFNLPLGTASTLILLIGVILLIRFFHRYPLPAQDSLS
ncbi:MAG: hypothetical protein JXA97_10635 [Anaerolineales bacterium]|nr:hypothetical protein [Anaerolineales bacterium]